MGCGSGFGACYYYFRVIWLSEPLIFLISRFRRFFPVCRPEDKTNKDGKYRFFSELDASTCWDDETLTTSGTIFLLFLALRRSLTCLLFDRAVNEDFIESHNHYLHTNL